MRTLRFSLQELNVSLLMRVVILVICVDYRRFRMLGFWFLSALAMLNVEIKVKCMKRWLTWQSVYHMDLVPPPAA